MFRFQLLIICVLPLMMFSSCDMRDGTYQTGASEASVLAELNERVYVALTENEFNTLDSLAAVVIEIATETDDQNALIDVKSHLVSSYIDRKRIREGEALLRENMQRIEEFGNPRQEMRALIQLSNFKYLENQDMEGWALLKEAMELKPKVEDPGTLGALYASRARAITDQDPVEALRLYYEAIEKFDESGNLNNKAVVHNNIGLIVHNQNDYEAALEEYKKSLEINRKIGNQLQMAANYNNIANSLSSLERKEEAADSLFKAVTINQRMGISPSLIQNYYNLAQIYLESDELDLAYSFFTQAYEESQSINFVPGIMYHAVGLADVLYEKGRYDEVQEYIDESRTLADRLNNLEVLSRGYNIEANLNERLGNFQQALLAIREAQEYEERINKIRRELEFEEVRARLELEYKTAENELLRQQLTYRERLSRNQQMALISLFIGVVFTAILLVVLFRNKNKLEKVNQSLKQKNRVITAKNEQLRFLNSELKHLNDEKGRLVGMIIHDLRNPLFAVIGFLELINESLTDVSEKEHLQMAMNSASRLNQLINSLLEVHSLEKETKELKLETVQVDELVKTTINNFNKIAMKKDIRILDDVAWVRADSNASYLSRIVDNLISNALKYSPRHSRVHVTVDKKGDQNWELVVKDEGPGISEEDQKNLYKMFGRLSAKPTAGEESTGLGLYTVKMLVSRLKGEINLESELGRGSRFICEFPISPALKFKDASEAEDGMNESAESELEFPKAASVET